MDSTTWIVKTKQKQTNKNKQTKTNNKNKQQKQTTKTNKNICYTVTYITLIRVVLLRFNSILVLSWKSEHINYH